MHAENKYFNQHEEDPTIDTVETDVRKVIKYDSYIYELDENKIVKQCDIKTTMAKSNISLSATNLNDTSETYELDTDLNINKLKQYSKLMENQLKDSDSSSNDTNEDNVDKKDNKKNNKKKIQYY